MSNFCGLCDRELFTHEDVVEHYLEHIASILNQILLKLRR